MNEYVLDFLYRDLTYIVTIFVSNGTSVVFLASFYFTYMFVCAWVAKDPFW
jgi:hypothetical protein